MADTDISTTFADRFAVGIAEPSHPATDIVTARLQRIQELERVRQEHLAAHSSNNDDSETRHSRRDRFIRQTTQRSTERRSFASNIQRTPVRSQSFENTNTICINEDTLTFRDFFESQRQTLFGARASTSNENIVSTSVVGRRPSEPLTVASVPAVQTDDDSGSGSSTPISGVRPQFDLGSGSNTPRTVRPQYDITVGLAEAFSNVRSSLLGSETSIAPRSSSVTREIRSSATNIQRLAMTNASPLTRSASQREPRRESRFRRRTIQGVDHNITQALEQERTQPSSSLVPRSLSPLVSPAVTKTAVTENKTTVKSSEITHASSYSAFSSYSSRYNKIELYPEDSVPALGFENEKVIFVDDTGHCHWLNKNHQIVRSVKAKTKLPEIIVKPRLTITNGEEADGFIATMEGDCEERYGKLRELALLAKRRDANFQSSDSTDSVRSLTLQDFEQRGDFIEEIDIDKKYKFVSLYTPPRARPDVKNYISKKEVPSLYDGIPRSQLPQEVIGRQENEPELKEPPPPVHGANKYLSARYMNIVHSARDCNGTASRTEQSRLAASHEHYSESQNEHGESVVNFARTQAQQESYSAESEIGANGHERVRFNRSGVRHEQAQVVSGDGVSNMLLRRAEARRQQYLAERQTTENGATTVERQAGEQRHQYAEERQTGEDGSTSHRQMEQFHEESTTHASTDTGSSTTIQRRSSQRQQQTSSTQVVRGRNTTSAVTQVEQSSTIRQSSRNETLRQASIDNSDIHGGVNLVMERLHMMQGISGMPLDTSHLDYEELLMIQKALAENPSPPDSPVNVEVTEIEYPEIVTVDESEYVEPTEEVKVIEEIEHDSKDNSASLAAGQNRTEIPSTINLAGQSSSALSRYSSQTGSSKPSAFSSPGTSFISAKETVITHSSSSVSSKEEKVPEPRTARYQRLPSEGAEARLPLPSIDWSPLEKNKSPISPKRFTFETKTETNVDGPKNLRLSSSAPTILTPKSTIPKAAPSGAGTSTWKPSVQDELTIEIPSENNDTTDNATKTSQSSANQKDCNKSETGSTKSSSSPLVSSRSISQSSSAAHSPSDGESVTTVFEEFVQTIPRSMLSNWPSSPNE